MTEMKLRYAALLLLLLRREARWTRIPNWTWINQLCDRFERVMDSIDHDPLLWEGDQA